jgi:serine/threonine protein phosphatase PrpC
VIANVLGERKNTLYAVFDGHGGSLSCSFAAEHICDEVERHWDGSDAEGGFKAAFEALNSAVCEHLRAASGRGAVPQSASLDARAAAVAQAPAALGLADAACESVQADVPAIASKLTDSSSTGARRGKGVPVCTGIVATDAASTAAAGAEGSCAAATSPPRWWAAGSSGTATLRAASSAGKAGSKAHNPFAASLNRVISGDGGLAASPAGAGAAGSRTSASPSLPNLPVSDQSVRPEAQPEAPAEFAAAADFASESAAENPRLHVLAAPASPSLPLSYAVASAGGCGGGEPADFDGCAALAVFLQGLTATVAGVGDCKAVLVRADGLHECVNTVHTADLPQERSRILAAGGTVSHDGRVCGSLNFTRSLGDLRLKARGVTCEPSVRQLVLQPHRDLAIVLATDGIWEVLDDALVARIVLTRGQFAASAVSEPVSLEAGAAQLRPGSASQPLTMHSSSGSQATLHGLQAASAHFTFPTPLPTPPSQLSGGGGGGSGLSCAADVIRAPLVAQSNLKPERHHTVSEEHPSLVCGASSANQAKHSPVGIARGAQWPTSTTSVGTASEASVSSTGSLLAPGSGGLPTPQLAEPRTIAERIVAEAQLRGAQDNMLVLVIDLTRPAGAALPSPPISA